MPHTRLEKLFFAVVTVFLSVHIFVFYNVALKLGGMSNRVFALGEREVPVEFALALLLALAVNTVTPRLAFRLVNPREVPPIVVILAITCMTMMIMCPAMSLAATLLYDGMNGQFLANWMQKVTFNFPMAFFSQIFLVGPLVRLLFRALFRSGEREAPVEEVLLEPELEGEYS